MATTGRDVIAVLELDSTKGETVHSAALTGSLTTRSQCEHIPDTSPRSPWAGTSAFGLKDDFSLPEGETATNAERVARAADLAWGSDESPTSDEAREILDVG